MKRIIVSILTLTALMFTLVACDKTEAGDQSSSNTGTDQSAPVADAKAIGADYATAVDSYGIDENTVVPYMNMHNEFSYMYPAQTAKELDDNSTEIVTGTVLSKEFCAFNGFGCFKVDLLVDSVLRGNILPGDTISIVQVGGYISIADHVKAFKNGLRFEAVPQEQWDTTYLCEGIPGLGFPQPNEKYAYFLAGIDKIYGNAYYPLNDDEGVFKLDADGVYKRANPYYNGAPAPKEDNALDSFTTEELTQLFAKQ